MASSKLVPKEEQFVLEYCLDWDHRRAALAAGYSIVMGTRLLKLKRIAEAVEYERELRREKYRVDADRITEEFAKIGYANARDYVPRRGQDLDIHRLNIDQTAAIENVNIDEFTDPKTLEPRRRINIKLHDKVAALTNLAKSVGMLTERHVIEGTIEHVINQLSPDERIERVRQLREKAEQVYLPAYEKLLEEEGHTIDGSAVELNPDGTDADRK